MASLKLWLEGKKKYVLLFIAFVGAIGHYLNSGGTMDLWDLLKELWLILFGGAAAATGNRLVSVLKNNK